MTKHHKTFKLLALSVLAFSMGIAASARAETTGQYVDDATITAKVKEAILADAQLKVLDVSVNSLHGTVTLSGAVDNKSQEAEAVRVAKMVNGVAMVKDNLSIKTTPRPVTIGLMGSALRKFQ
jgi:osmotically-inducible protein OsmY